MRANIQLAVQSRPRLIGDQLQAGAPRGHRAEPLVRLKPDRVSRAVRVPVSIDGRGEDLNLPGRRGERMLLRVNTELGERHLRLAGHRQLDAVAGPELVKTRNRSPAPRSERIPPLPIQVPQPLHRGTAL